MSILETVLIYVGIPLLITAVIAGLSFTGRKTAGPVPKPYRLTQSWTHAPVLWSAVDEPVTHAHHGGHHAVDAAPADLIGGSASGKW
ncbi:hypothetical protein [Rhodococcus sp. HNM0569]|uniref:aa3-type cytochrome oxidase subunit CtaJ n=1 Tax=Rhodococcus sp. HNM0569 TaxID=2716340 RepID=UPI00146B71AE|nr:hypothetical protein [Rhodococcus sp. HNM0569]